MSVLVRCTGSRTFVGVCVSVWFCAGVGVHACQCVHRTSVSVCAGVVHRTKCVCVSVVHRIDDVDVSVLVWLILVF